MRKADAISPIESTKHARYMFITPPPVNNFFYQNGVYASEDDVAPLQ